MYQLPDTCSVTDFRDNIADHLRDLRRSSRPRMITQNGKAAAVVLSPEQFEGYAAAREFMETVRAVEESRRELARGGGSEWAAVRARLLRDQGRKRSPRRKTA
jgi:PHD/YefM family antitoxin component YafN of YafNO toxin-antitoxin module